jgi:hypothetical protein
MFSRWIVTNTTSDRRTVHCRKTRIPCRNQLVTCGEYITNELIPWRQNPKVHHRVRDSLPPVPILSQLNTIHTRLQPIFPRSILIPSSHLRLGLPSGLFPSGFPTKTLYTFLSLLRNDQYEVYKKIYRMFAP